MTAETFLDGRVTLHAGDMLTVLDGFPENSLDSVVCDPPYHLTSIVKRFGASGAAACKPGTDGAYARASAGFMGKQWDGGDIAFRPETWAHVLRVLKPGGYLVAFGGTRGWHRMTCAIEDAGFEIRDSISYLSDGGLTGPLLWTYGAGFPKSHDPAKHLRGLVCDCCGPRTVEPETAHDVRGMRRAGQNASPEQAQEAAERLLHPLLPREDGDGAAADAARAQGTIGLDGRKFCVVPGEDQRRTELGLEGRCDPAEAAGQLRQRPVCEVPGSPAEHGADGRLRDGASAGDGRVGRSAAAARRVRASSRPHAAQQPEVELGAVAGQPEPQAGGAWPDCPRCGKPIVPDGLGTALKPAWEPIVLARKQLDGTVAANVLRWGTGALNIAGCRVEGAKPDTTRGAGGQNGAYSPLGAQGRILDDGLGRWPANLIHDGSEEVIAAFPDVHGAGSARKADQGTHSGRSGLFGLGEPAMRFGDAGSAARFFYSAKADDADRLGSKHPTVKPLDLIQYLVRLVTPPGGLVLDCFAGTGTTGEAAFREGMRAILIEREPAYQTDIRRRMALCLAGPDERRRATIKAKSRPDDLTGTLFAPPPVAAE